MLRVLQLQPFSAIGHPFLRMTSKRWNRSRPLFSFKSKTCKPFLGGTRKSETASGLRQAELATAPPRLPNRSVNVMTAGRLGIDMYGKKNNQILLNRKQDHRTVYISYPRATTHPIAFHILFTSRSRFALRQGVRVPDVDKRQGGCCQ